MRRSTTRNLAVLAVCGLAAGGASAQTPLGSAITYQGELRASGQPAAGPVDLRFRLYTSVTGGAQIGTTIDRPASAVSAGRFAQELDFGATAFGADARWLEIDVRSPAAVGSYVTLAPRQRITPAPAASFASRPWVTNGTDVSYVGGNVGVGTTSPSAKVSILGDWNGTEGALRISGDKPTIGFSGGALSGHTSWITHLGTGGILTFARNLSPTTFSYVLNLTANDRVGIGTTNPASTLDGRARSPSHPRRAGSRSTVRPSRRST